MGALAASAVAGGTRDRRLAKKSPPATPKNGPSDAGLQQVLDALPAAVYTTDIDGRITFYNRAAVELAGREPELGKDQWCVSWHLYGADGTPLPHDQCPMATALKTGEPVRGVELIVERPDGQRLPVLPYPTPLRDDEGRMVGAVNVLVDISERRSAESRQRALLQELNHRVKNNLQMLHALLSTARRDSRNASARAILAEAGQRVSAMATAQRVLYEADNAHSFGTQAFLEAVCDNARRSLGGELGIELSCEAHQLSNDMAVPLALILNELLSNAVKHGLKGRRGGVVRVALTRDLAASYLLTVEDDGPGFTLRKVRKNAAGLGLVIGIARQLGGNLAVTRTPGARCAVRFVDRHR